MDIYGLNILDLILPIGLIGLISFLGIMFYVLYYRPKVQPPLPNERSLGFLTLWLPKGFGLHSGHATTARRTLEKQFTRLIENEIDETTRKNLQSTRKLFNKFHPIAHKVARQTFIYLFTHNPEDQRYIDIDPNQNNAYILHGVQDVMLGGEWGKFQFLGVKLNPTTQAFTKDEHKLMRAGLESIKYLEDAAKNKEKIHDLEDELKYTREDRNKQRREVAKLRSLLDRGLSALGQKPLTVPPEVKVPGAWKSKVKEWFTWPQLLTGALAYMLAPHIQEWARLTLTPPATTYFAAFITALGFFIIPISKKVFGRWL